MRAPACAPFRSCPATPRSRALRSTRTSRGRASGRPTSRPTPVPDARRRRLAPLLLLALAAGCARKQPPSGGPPDLEPPSVLSVSPDSGATAVDRTGRITVEFSEGMDPRSAALAVEIAPRVEVKTRHWSGRKLTLVLADSLKANQT